MKRVTVCRAQMRKQGPEVDESIAHGLRGAQQAARAVGVQARHEIRDGLACLRQVSVDDIGGRETGCVQIGPSGRRRAGFVGGTEVHLDEGIDARPLIGRLRPCAGHLQECPSFGGGAVSLACPAHVAVDHDVGHQLFGRRQNVVEPVDFGSRVRHPPTVAHDGVKGIRVRRVERDQQCDNRVPRFTHHRADLITPNLAEEPALTAWGSADGLSVKGGVRLGRGRIEDSQEARQARDHQVPVECGDRPGGQRGVGVGQDLEPFSESDGVERVVGARLGVVPGIQVEDRGELSRCCQRDQFGAGVEATGLDNLMQGLRSHRRNDVLQVWRVEQAGKLAAGGRQHGPAMIRGPRVNKQS